jgi:hypothetical protein
VTSSYPPTAVEPTPLPERPLRRCNRLNEHVGRKAVICLPLNGLELHSQENLGLLLNLLGLQPPEEALACLDGVLIGLRTRALLQRLLEARCRPSAVVWLIEHLGALDLKGISGPARAWTALRSSSLESRFEALHATAQRLESGRVC